MLLTVFLAIVFCAAMAMMLIACVGFIQDTGKTVLVIAHRMRTVEAADKIVVLSDGRVAEEGSPAELLGRENSLFRHMTQLQNASAGWSV